MRKVHLLVALLALASSTFARIDEDEAVMFEAADLSEAHPPELAEELRGMESLLHWAIGERGDPMPCVMRSCVMA